MILLLKLIRESFLFAFKAIIVNRVRTILSLLGITIGILSVILVLSIFGSLEKSIRDSISELGNDVLFIQKWPWSMGGEYPWWKYLNRPQSSVREMDEIQKRSSAAESVAFMFNVRRTVKYRNNSIENTTAIAISYDYDKVLPLDIQEGRYFTHSETLAGRSVAIIGSEIAENLFGNADPIGKRVKIFGNKVDVIGVLARQGEGMFGNSTDEQIYIPLNFARNFIDTRYIETTMMIKAKPNITNQELRDELTGIMRSLRKIKPGDENDFAINEVSIINKGLTEFFAGLATIGWIIGGFSLLVGGFGIANIMFVSVRERTNIIGIQKAIGAKKYFILLEFLFEAVFLSLIGGIVGLVFVFLALQGLQNVIGFDLVLSQGNIVVALVISTIIGLVSGFVPALVASKLNPVEAIRFGA